MAFDFGTAFVKVKALLDDFRDDVVREATKAGDEGGKAASAGVSRQFNAAGAIAKGFGLAASGAFALAAAGSRDLEDAVAKVRSETGLTGQAAAELGTQLNRLSGNNAQSLEEIGDTLSSVHTNLGLTGAAAEATTQDFLTFARATRQDAASAVSAFDDILDGFGLTAADAAGIMDQLVASTQKYGGTVPDLQAALGSLGPALRAMNLGVDDGIGLLNLFASSGIDAGDAAGLLSRAIAGLKPGQDINDLVAQLGAIEDPTRRAQAAIELFGRQGAKIANAIKPGTQSIDEFIIRAEDVPTATEDARAALESTFGEQIQAKLRQFGATITSVLGQGGPVLTSLASLGTLAASFGVDDLLRKLGPGFVGAMKDLGQKGADALSDGFQAVLTGAEGTVAGNFIASRIEAIVDSGKNSRIADAVVKAGAAAGALYSRSVALAMAGAGAVQAMAVTVAAWLAAIPGVAAVTAAASAAGRSIAGSMVAGFAAALGPLALFVGATTLAFTEIQKARETDTETLRAQADKQGGLYGAMARQSLAHRNQVVGDSQAIAAGLTATQLAVQNGGADWQAKIAAYTAIGERISASVAQGTNALLALVPGWKNVAQAADEASPPVKRFVTAMSAASEGIGQQFQLDAAGAVLHFGYIREAAEEAFTGVATAVKNGIEAIGTLPIAASDAGAAVLQGVADGINSARRLPLDALDALVEAMKHPLSQTKETARLIGELTGKELAAGLTSADPAIRAQARATKEAILERLEEIKPRAGTVSKEAMADLVAGMKNADPEIRGRATKIYEAITGAVPTDLKKKGSDATTNLGGGLSSGITQHVTPAVNAGVSKIEELHIPGVTTQRWGYNIGSSWGAGVASGIGSHTEDVKNAAASMTLSLKGESPPKTGPLREIDKWGRNTALAWVDDFIKGLGDAPAKAKNVLGFLQSELTKFLGNLKPLGSLFGGLTPEADRVNLRRYIDSLQDSLPALTDPTERLAAIRQINDYQERYVALSGKVATADQKQAQALQQAISKINQALLTETDPKRIDAMTTRLESYVGRLDKLLAPRETIAGVDPDDVKENALAIQRLDLEHRRALLAATPELEKQNATELDILDAKLDQLDSQRDEIEYQREMNRLLLEKLNLQRQSAGQKALDKLPAGSSAAAPQPIARNTDVDAYGNRGHYESGRFVIDTPGRGPTAAVAPTQSADPYGTDASGNSLNPYAANVSNPGYLNNGDVNPNTSSSQLSRVGDRTGPNWTPEGQNNSVTVNNYYPEPESTPQVTERSLRIAAMGLGLVPG